MSKPPANPKIQHWDDERDIGNSLIVTLKPGWKWFDRAEHVRGFDTKTEALRDLRKVTRCDCPDCKKAAA